MMVQYVAQWWTEDGSMRQTDPVPTRDLASRLANLIIMGTPSLKPVGPIMTVGVA
jgi:hypothetical protein